MNPVVEFFSGCLIFFTEYEDSFSRKERMEKNSQELLSAFERGKGEYYYTKLKMFAEDVDRSSIYGETTKLEQFEFGDSLCNDIRRLQNIFNCKRSRNFDSLQNEIIKAIGEGFPIKILQEIAGPAIDVEALTDNSKNEKFQQYIKILSTDCSVCLDPFSEADFVAKKVHRASCHHFYHTNCLERWMDSNRNCPICRVFLPFEDEKVAWQEYLKSIDGAIKNRFPGVVVSDQDPKMDSDEVLARLLQSQFDKENDRAQQVEEDTRIAVDLFLNQVDQ